VQRITCEVCGSNDLLKSDGVFVCQYCGCKYSLEEVKHRMVELTGPVKVEGINNADSLYNKAMDWLSLKNYKEAANVLHDMTREYPADPRGWMEWVRLCVVNPDIYNNVKDASYLAKFEKADVDNALSLGGEQFTQEIEKKVSIYCNKIHNGEISFLDGVYFANPAFTGWFYWTNRFSEIDCVKELFKKAEENALFCYEQAKRPFFELDTEARYHTSRDSREFTIFFNAWGKGKNENYKPEEDGRPINTYMLSIPGQVKYIIGKNIIYKTGEFFEFGNLLSNELIKNTLDKIEYYLKNGLCPRCGRKLWRHQYCRNCKTKV